MKLKKKVNDFILIILFLIIMFLCMINEINNTTGFIIYIILGLILAINLIILYKYGRED